MAAASYTTTGDVTRSFPEQRKSLSPFRRTGLDDEAGVSRKTATDPPQFWLAGEHGDRQQPMFLREIGDRFGIKAESAGRSLGENCFGV
jgi:hypothetical protein